jgi:macrodomain Ter protein organizer (MatP/YcbG family)
MKTHTGIRLKDKTLQALRRLAKREQETLSETIRRILEEAVKA